MEGDKSLSKIFGWILNIILLVLLVVGVYLFFDRIFGNSLTDFQLILWMAGFFGTATIKLFNLIYGINREIGELKMGVKHGFEKVRMDIQDIKKMIKGKK